MSADAWSICPNCLKRFTTEADSRDIAVAEAYGTIPAEEYKAKAAAAYDFRQKGIEESMREDYEIGVSKTGEFSVDYGASCQNCSFRFSYRHTEQVPVEVK